MAFIKKNKVNIIIILIFFITPFFFFNDSFKIGSLIFGNGDPNYNTVPLWDFIISSVKSGEFPFWNKSIYSGFPSLANPQASIFYPILWILYFVFPLSVAYNLSIFIHYSLAGIFIFIFLDRYKLNKIASFMAGLVFMFSGIMICHKGHAQMLYTAVWFPFILYFIDKFRETRKFQFILFGSLFYSISFFGGHPQIFLYGSIILFSYIIYYAFIYGRKNYYVLISLAIFAVTIILISVQLFPTYELMKNSIRGALDFGNFSFFSYSKKLIPTLIAPFIYGAGRSGVQFFGSLSYIETIGYFSVSAIPFIILGFFSKNKDKFFWIFILVFSFILVLGSNTPIYQYLFHVPLYNKFRIPTRNWFEFGIAFSILTGFGFDYLIKDFNKIVKRTIISISAIFIVIATFLGISNKLLNNLSKTNILDKFYFLKENLSLLLKTTLITNYAIYVPLIFLIITAVFLLVSILKRNKVVYIILIIILFFDLKCVGNFIEGSSDSSYVYKNLNQIQEYNFLNKNEEPFRVYPVVDFGPLQCTFYPSRNLHYNIDIISGLDPLLLGEYNALTGMIEMDKKERAEMLLRNNNVLSFLNTKYITYFKPDNDKDLMDNITKKLYDRSETVLNESNFDNIEKKFVGLNNGTITIKGNESESLKYIKIPIRLKQGTDYLISFNISENLKKGEKSVLNNNLYIDFYSEGFDNPEQEFVLKQDEITTNFKSITKDINSGEVPDNKMVYFRIFTYSKGEIIIKNLNIDEVTVHNYNNYSITNLKDVIVITNKDYLDRFYFVKEILKANNFSEAADLVWDKNSIWNNDRFNPKTQAIVENYDYSKTNFNTNGAILKLIDYTNNTAILKTSSKNEQFLVFSDTFYPGWRAYIDGAITKIYKTNGIIKGIIIPPGDHIIKFSFYPNSFWIYLSISGTAFFSIIVILILLHFKHSKSDITQLQT